MAAVKLSKDELKKIDGLLEKFPTIDSVTIVTGQTGIGQTLEVLFDTYYNGVPGVFKVDLTDVSNW
jgi:hypothetical protein